MQYLQGLDRSYKGSEPAGNIEPAENNEHNSQPDDGQPTEDGQPEVSDTAVEVSDTAAENNEPAEDSNTAVENNEVRSSTCFHDAFQDLGYETRVGDSGLSLSGGQRMMVAITIVMIKGSKIVLLNEATAPFDPKTEMIFQRLYRSLSPQRR